jgi:hypothetical protein
MGDLRIGVGAPGDSEGTDTLSAKKKGVLDGDAGCGVSRMGEFMRKADIPGSIDPRITCAQEIICLDPGFCIILLMEFLRYSLLRLA